ncbi:MULTISPECIES: bifunctional riboflavin kinase/FAD synthetase [Carnobacterium]|uniref:Riboflavin biosynthesis protein n=1 Tax=Carnobacterium divergens TaxID=2748 RepID=A0A2R7ZZV4_CARDV|nr:MULTISPECIES: bifunctional riboflavin kinase/FAD synthetase [Carnobacterium]MCO6017908.1 bifunctional riboflavin kinase/FAD synthetase [Carnobacterium divergens]MDT1938735.1 bifunctional riboflavin kinase/FAD synthetase [Carnobacterium divergens]MDT1941173.1 bifunctional riboflavin kinase/FAD synthetase [Carnobacterium divergens]MDT1946971.1 bifunctional riboflavin kinase/FAD synthetase [Carnobacterium divergens]MDT1949408.1 bifunctional riboflavin kinase/FAD synthetase [Carnobacterium dive
MKVVNIHHPYQSNQIPTDDVVLALGFFDGVHLGHQEVIATAKKIAKKKNLKLALMTFNQHPSIVFQKIDPDQMKYLSTIKRKEELMAAQGVDILYVIEFTSAFASLSPIEFVNQYMVDLHAKVVVAGFDYTYGPKDTANMEQLPRYADKRFEVVTVEKQETADEKISSTRIRKELAAGNMKTANELLGYAYEVPGRVVHGDARGRLLGFPTANIEVDAGVRLPRVGVYAVKIKVGNQWHLGMASIGYNVTFGDNRDMTVEVYILDFNEDIYGERVSVSWHHYLRDELKFDSVVELIAQLKQDEVDTTVYFNNEK